MNGVANDQIPGEKEVKEKKGKKGKKGKGGGPKRRMSVAAHSGSQRRMSVAGGAKEVKKGGGKTPKSITKLRKTTSTKVKMVTSLAGRKSAPPRGLVTRA